MQLSKVGLKTYRQLVQEGGRLSPSGITTYLIGIFIFSAFTVGLGYAVANANTVGWNNLERGWQVIFYSQAVLFATHLIFILISFLKTSIFRKLTSIALVLFTYKTVLDQFIMLFMFYKDRGVYDQYAPYTFFIIICGFIFHLFALRGWFRKELNSTSNTRTIKREGQFRSLSLILIFVSLVTIMVRNGFLASFELVFILGVMTVLLIALLIGVCEFIFVSFLMFKYPEILETGTLNKRRRKKRA